MRSLARLLTAVTATMLLACAQTPTAPGGGDASGNEPTTGSLTIAVTGLPVGVSASLQVTGPGGFFVYKRQQRLERLLAFVARSGLEEPRDPSRIATV